MTFLGAFSDLQHDAEQSRGFNPLERQGSHGTAIAPANCVRVSFFCSSNES
jgi:hypothetical protein